MWSSFKIGFGLTAGFHAVNFIIAAVSEYAKYLEDKEKDSQENTEEQTETSE